MYQNKNILVLGMARSGIAVSKLLAKYNNKVTLSDMKEQDEEVIKELEALGINIVITDKQEDLVSKDYDIVVKNPAIKRTVPAVVKAKELGLPVINEVEVSYKLIPKDCPIITVTGSNGKTTTTTLIYEFLKTTGKKIHLCGNMGIPFASIVEDIKPGEIVVMEISDHQLCDMYEFTSNISVMTNLSQVHLDFHDGYELYKQTKKKIFNNHTKDSLAVLNGANEDVLELTKDIPDRKVYFSAKKKCDAYLEDNAIYYSGERIIDLSDIKIKGNHNYENIMVAIIVSKEFGVTNDQIKSVLKDFGGVEHRIEFVKELNGRKIYNDSKATNNESTIIALKSFTEPTILLMGGLDRNIPFDPIKEALTNVKLVVCYGETKNKIKEFMNANNVNTIVVETLVEAVHKAYENSESGDVILLSPACASWDQFPDFEVRGKVFKEEINKLN